MYLMHVCAEDQLTQERASFMLTLLSGMSYSVIVSPIGNSHQLLIMQLITVSRWYWESMMHINLY